MIVLNGLASAIASTVAAESPAAGADSPAAGAGVPAAPDPATPGTPAGAWPDGEPPVSVGDPDQLPDDPVQLPDGDGVSDGDDVEVPDEDGVPGCCVSAGAGASGEPEGLDGREGVTVSGEVGPDDGAGTGSVGVDVIDGSGVGLAVRVTEGTGVGTSGASDGGSDSDGEGSSVGEGSEAPADPPSDLPSSDFPPPRFDLPSPLP